MDRNGAFASSDDAFSAAVYFVCDILLVFRFILVSFYATFIERWHTRRPTLHSNVQRDLPHYKLKSNDRVTVSALKSLVGPAHQLLLPLASFKCDVL